jgi:hypothetical protein
MGLRGQRSRLGQEASHEQQGQTAQDGVQAREEEVERRIVPTPDSVRGPIEQTHNKTRDDREKQYVTDRVALETAYHSDLKDIQEAKEAALVAAGLNPDGGVPPTFDGMP